MSTIKATNLQNAASSFVNLQTVADGSVLFGQMPNPPYSYQRNKVINGAMTIAQRATSATVSAGVTTIVYPTVDRFYAYCTGANVTMSQATVAAPGRSAIQFAGAASVTAISVGHRIESLNCYDMAGRTCTLSLKMSNSLLTSVTWSAYYATTNDTFGTIAAPTRTLIATGTFTVSGTYTTYSTTMIVPSAAITGIEIVLSVGAQISGTWVVSEVQLETGAVATPFERRPYQQELAMCQRYYELVTGTASNAITAVIPTYPYKVQKRAAPTLSGVTVSTGTGAAVTNSTYDATYGAYLSTANSAAAQCSFTATAEL